MDQFNLSRYANLTVQRVQAPEEKPLPKTVENEEDCSDEEDEYSGSDEEEANKTLEVPKIEDDGKKSDEIIPTLTDENVDVKLESENHENRSDSESKNNEQNDEEIEVNLKRKCDEEEEEEGRGDEDDKDEDDQNPKKAKMNEESTDINI